MNSKIGIFYKNTLMLYILTFSSYFFSFVSIPYQTRVLGPDYFGRVGFALAFMTYFRMIVDFGFILSATEDVANNKNDKVQLSRIVTSVNIVKLILTLITFTIVLLLCLKVDRFKSEFFLYIITFFSVTSASFFPDYLYRGLENMKTITIRTVIIKALFVIMIFVFLNDKSDYKLIPFMTLIGNVLANIFSYIHAWKVEEVKFVKVKITEVFEVFKKSSFFFYSRIASTAYTITNTFLIGLIYPVGSNAVGLYTSADKLVNTAKQGFSPIADSLYPYMIKNRDFKLVKKIIFILMPPVLLGALIVSLYANSFVAFLLGDEFRNAGEILRILMPVVVMSPLIYIMGFPVLTPMGLSKHGNFSTICASFIHISLLILLYSIKMLNIYTLSYATLFSQFVILAYRIFIIWIKSQESNNITNTTNACEGGEF